MDSADSAASLARELGTSVPRVARAARRLGIEARRGGRLALTSEQAGALRDELGTRARLLGLTGSPSAALAALARSPFGLPSARAVAAKAGLSPTAASRAVAALIDAGLVRGEPARIVASRPRSVVMLHANRQHPRYKELAADLRRIKPRARPRDERVPPRLRHLFWNSSPTQLEVEHGGPYIARRLLRALDPAGLAWGARNLRPEDWLKAAEARGLDPATRALARNLADHGES